MENKKINHPCLMFKIIYLGFDNRCQMHMNWMVQFMFLNNEKFIAIKCLIFGKSYGLILNKKDNFDLTGTKIDAKNDFEIAQIALSKSNKERKLYGL